MTDLIYDTIRKLLEPRREIAIIWGVGNVKEIRPDLTDDQAWDILQQCYYQHNHEDGITYDIIANWAEFYFPEEKEDMEDANG
jgi:hypothetical protein